MAILTSLITKSWIMG